MDNTGKKASFRLNFTQISPKIYGLKKVLIHFINYGNKYSF